MDRYDETCAECWVFTFKQGLLSAVAHDLRLRVGRFRVEVDRAKTQVLASFDPSSLYVDSPMKDGAENPSALSLADKHKIAQQIRDEVLHVDRYSSISFRSRALLARSDGGYDVSGELTLHGATRPLQAETHLVGERQVLEVTLAQSDFGIASYRALLGTLKIQNDVKLRIVV